MNFHGRDPYLYDSLGERKHQRNVQWLAFRHLTTSLVRTWFDYILIPVLMILTFIPSHRHQKNFCNYFLANFSIDLNKFSILPQPVGLLKRMCK